MTRMTMTAGVRLARNGSSAARSSKSATLLLAIRHGVRQWMDQRRQRRELAMLSDRMLRDIGLDRMSLD